MITWVANLLLLFCGVLPEKIVKDQLKDLNSKAHSFIVALATNIQKKFQMKKNYVRPPSVFRTNYKPNKQKKTEEFTGGI